MTLAYLFLWGEGTVQPSAVTEIVGDRNRIWIFFYNKVTKGKFYYFQQINYSCQKKKKSRHHAFINSRTIGGQPADHLETSPWLSPPGLRETFVNEHHCVTSDVPLNLFIFFSDSQLKVKKKNRHRPLCRAHITSIL